MNTKNIILTGVLFLLIGSVHATDKNTSKKNIDKKACRYVLQRIAVIQEFHSLEEGYGVELTSASNFLEKITKIKSKSGYSYETIGETKNNDLKTWKNWFNENKHLLHWDRKTKTVVIN